MIDVPLVKYGVLIPIINALSSFPIFNEERTNLNVEELTFFANYNLLVAQSFSTIPPVTMHYLWDDSTNDVVKLDGTQEAVFNHLNTLGLILSEKTIIPYLKFVLDHIHNEGGTLRLTESVDEIDFSDYPTNEQMNLLKEIIRPAVVVDEGETFFVCCIVIYDDTLYEAEIRLEKSGLFEFVSEKEIGEKMNCLRPIFLE